MVKKGLIFIRFENFELTKLTFFERTFINVKNLHSFEERTLIDETLIKTDVIKWGAGVNFMYKV